MNKKTKIVAKIADNRSELPFLKSLFDAGADVAWLNTAHQDEPATLGVIERLRQLNPNIPILLDTKGPEIRTKDVKEPISVKPGDYITFTGDDSITGENVVHVTYPNFHNEVPVGSLVLYDDASIESVVESKTAEGIKCKLKNGGTIKSKKSLNIPGVHINLPALSEKDKSFMHFCAKNNVDFIIHSFVRNVSDLNEIKSILKEYPDYRGKILSKIENREGFDNIEEILDNSEGIMVARGDLGAEVPLEELPYMQKKMVEAALRKGKYSIVATQVLDSMIKNPRPTRAEVTDAANAILDGTAAISMSGETAYGDYPLEATATMARIMSYTESKRDELIHFTAMPEVKSLEYTQAQKVLAEAKAAGATTIVISEAKPVVAYALSTYRPDISIVSVSTDADAIRELALAYAVVPVLVSKLDKETVVASARPFVKKGETVLFVSEGVSEVKKDF